MIYCTTHRQACYPRQMNAARMLVMVLVCLATTVRADVPVTQVGFTNGDDWESAIAADGPYVYVAWAHFGTPQQDSSGATCKTKGVASYAYFQRSINGGATWEPYIIPRCPVSGTQIDLQIVVGPNHRVYVSYMDGAAGELERRADLLRRPRRHVELAGQRHVRWRR